MSTEALKYVWGGAIPLQIHLHNSEVTTLPPPPPALILAPRIGFLPLLVPRVKPLFRDTLPPGADAVWFDYKGLPLKWYIPTGVLFDLLCAEPERPWNLTIHFRGYPGNILIPYDGEDNVKWSFINSLKEANFIISGNCKSVMNMSQSDQLQLWLSVLNADLESYIQISSKLKLETYGECNPTSDSSKSQQQGRIPVRLYIRNIYQSLEEVEDAPHVDTWDNIVYINKPVGRCLTLGDAVRYLMPGLYEEEEGLEAEIKMIRIQGIEPELEIPFSWVVSNLKNPDHFLHISLYLLHLKPCLPPPAPN